MHNHIQKIGFGIVMGICVIVFSAGCTPSIPIPENTIIVDENESNANFALAQTLPLSASTPVKINGSFSGLTDTDVFLLGSLQAGQKIDVDLRGTSMMTQTDAAFGLFDENQDVAYIEQNTLSGSTDTPFSLIVRKSGNYYLGLYGQAGREFPYSALVSLESCQVPTPTNQIVYLNYDGAVGVTIGSDYFGQVLPFTNFGYSTTAKQLAAQVTDLIRKDFTGLDITILSSFESPIPSDPHSTVHISSNEDSFFGLADSVDWYNADHTDNAIIFAGLLDNSNLSQDQFIIATANVAAHELGHLVGLAHTDDDTELMDIQTPLNGLTRLQDFHRAPLARDEFPIGTQDSIELLQFALGLLQ